jgi:beta-glucosidase
MPDLKSLKLFPLLAVAVLVETACSLSPPKPDPSKPSGIIAICSGIGGTGGGVDGGTEVDGGGYVTVPSPAPQCNVANVTVRLPYTEGYTPKQTDLDTVKTLIAGMSLTDKLDQMRGMPYSGSGKTQMSDVERSQDTRTIRGFRYRDASRGMNLAEDMEGVKPNAGKVNGTPVGYATVFPVSMARGAAFDLDLEFAIGEAIGDEMMAAQQTLLLAPCMNILRHPLWGRAQETYGEDSFHIGRLASAMAQGVQKHIAANAKHYMAYDIEFGRDQNNMILDEQTMRETYGRHFRMVVQDGGVSSVMAAYNQVNNEKSTVNHHLLTDILRTDFGFRGFVLSDWWAMDPQTKVDTDPITLKGYAIAGVRAGLDVELPWTFNYALLQSIIDTNGGVSTDDVETSAARVLEQKVRFQSYDLQKSTWGLGSPKTLYENSAIVYSKCDHHVDLARKAAIESMVLLKNDRTLPISAAHKKVAVLGVKVPFKTVNDGNFTYADVDFATEIRTGDMGSSRAFSDPKLMVGPFDGIKKTAPEGVEVVKGASVNDANVQDADMFVVIAGLTSEDEGEEYTKAGDRDSFLLDAKQNKPENQNIQNNLITAAAATGKPVVVVLEGSSIIDLPWLDSVGAVVMAWYPGMVGGEAMGMLLWGQYQGKTYNFSGKLPFTWGHQSDFPPFKGLTGTTVADYYLGYRLFDLNGLQPVFAFGHGLSYTKFTYSHLQIGCSEASEGAVLPVYVDVTNAGDVAGDEIVFLFASFPQPKAARRTTIKELKGFARVSLDPGETKQVLIPVRLKDLDYYDPAKNAWVVDDGEITIRVGRSSTDFPLTGTVTVHGYAKASSNY